MNGSIENIIYFLITVAKPVTMKQLSEEFEISEKTVWNRLNSYEVDILIGDKVVLKKERNVGVSLSGTKKDIQDLKKKIILSFGKKDVTDELRQNSILIDLLLRNKHYTIKDLMAKYFVSRKVLLNDLEDLDKYIENLEVRIEKRQNLGLIIVGDEILIRQLLERTILQTSFYFKEEMRKNVIFDEGIKLVLKRFGLMDYLPQAIKIVDEIQKEILGFFTDESKKEIILQILISHFCSKYDNPILQIEDELFSMEGDFASFKKIFKDNYFPLSANDYLYIWRRCINNRFSNGVINRTISEDVTKLAMSLLEGVIEISAEDDSQFLIDDLAFHLTRAIKRSEMGIRINNPVLDRIKDKYGKFYSLMLIRVNQLEKEYDIALNEDEIGFITLYICAMYEKQIKEKYYNVLLISNESIGQTELISMHLVNKFPNLLIKNSSSSFSSRNEELEDVDLILSTTPLLLKPEHRSKFIRISNFTDEEDLDAISQFINDKKKNEQKVSQLLANYDVDLHYFESDFDDRDELLANFSAKAIDMDCCLEKFQESVLDREIRASTSIGKGVAIPHGSSQYIKKNTIFIIKNRRNILWAQDEVNIIVFLIVKFTNAEVDGMFLTRLYNCLENTDLIRNATDSDSLEEIKKYIFNGEA